MTAPNHGARADAIREPASSADVSMSVSKGQRDAPDLEVGSRGATDVASRNEREALAADWLSEVTLTESERASITRCIEEHGGVCREVMCDESLDETVRLIVAARLAETTTDLTIHLMKRHEAEAEIARLRATLAWVEALVDRWDWSAEAFHVGEVHAAIIRDLRVALAGGGQ